MKIYTFANIAAYDFPTEEDLDNDWLYGGVKAIINVSEYDLPIEVLEILEEREISISHFPLSLDNKDAGWGNLLGAVVYLLKYYSETPDIKVIICDDNGDSLSRAVIEAFHYARKGYQFEDRYKNYENRLTYFCKTGHLPTIRKVESILRFLVGKGSFPYSVKDCNVALSLVGHSGKLTVEDVKDNILDAMRRTNEQGGNWIHDITVVWHDRNYDNEFYKDRLQEMLEDEDKMESWADEIVYGGTGKTEYLLQCAGVGQELTPLDDSRFEELDESEEGGIYSLLASIHY